MTLEQKRGELFQTGSTFASAARSDIAGIDSTLQQIDLIIHWLLNARHYTERKSRLQPGLLFEGLPGTGKTLCARYVATASEALFVDVRDWPIDGDVIAGQDISDLFDCARTYYRETGRPVILFWDEFEGFAMDRNSIGPNMRQASVVSQLTAEMDGVNGKSEGVLFIGCTNYKDSIDSALLRPGRMGLHIKFNAPDQAGKTKLLSHYLSKFEVATDLDYDAAAYFFENHETAASVEEAVQRVWLRAVVDSVSKDEDPLVTNALANEVLLDRLLGPPPPFMELRPGTYRRVAVHELGHALVAHDLGVQVKIVTIRPGETSFGRTYLGQPYDKIATVDDQFNRICCFIGSVYSERLAGISQSAATRNDTQQASRAALELANYRNTNLLNFDAYDVRAQVIPHAISDDTLLGYDHSARATMSDAQAQVKTIIESVGQDQLLLLADRLVEDITWTGPQFYNVLSGRE